MFLVLAMRYGEEEPDDAAAELAGKRGGGALVLIARAIAVWYSPGEPGASRSVR